MGYIFLDESGDLGFDFSKDKTSKFFIITFIFVKHKRILEKIVKQIFRKLTGKERKYTKGILHCYKTKPSVRKAVLSKLSSTDVSIIAIVLNKNKVYTKLKNEKHVLYNYVTNILLDRVFTKNLVPTSEIIHLIASKRETNKFLNENFRNYIRDSNRQKIDIKAEIRTPIEEKSLQIADFASWAIFRKYELNDMEYYNIIKNVISEENFLFS